MIVAASFWSVVLQVLGYLSIVLIVVSVAFMIRGLRRESRIRPLVLVVPVAAAVVALVVYVVILDVALIGPLSWPLLAGGLILGVISSRATRMRHVSQGVVGRRSVWHLVVWGLTFAATQALAMSRSAQTVAYGLSSVFFSTGLTSGTNAGLLVSYLARRTEPVEAAVAARPAAPQTAGEPVAASAGAPAAAGTTAGAADGGSVTTPPAVCPACGHPVLPDARFCTTCGAALIR